MNLHPMSSAPFEKSVSVMPEDIDEQNHVNNTVYLRWVQEVATAHWKAIASREAQKGIGWVVLGTRSTTKHQPVWAMTSCCARGSVKRPGLRSNGSPKFCGAAMASCCQRLERSGARLMRKPAGQCACRSTCASSFRFEFRCAHFPLLARGTARITVRVRSGAGAICIIPHPPLSLSEGEATFAHHDVSRLDASTLNV